MSQSLQIYNFWGVTHVFGEAAWTSSSYGSKLVCAAVNSAAWVQHRGVGIQWSLGAGEDQLGRQNIWCKKWKIIAKIPTRTNFPLPGKFREGVGERGNQMSSKYRQCWREGGGVKRLPAEWPHRCRNGAEVGAGGEVAFSGSPAPRELISVCIQYSACLIEF